MPDRSVQVTLTNVFQLLQTLIAAKFVADGLPPLQRFHFRVIDIMISKDTTGIVSLQKGIATTTNPFIELEAGEGQGFESGTRLNNESLEGIWIKSTVNAATEKANILLQE